MVDLLKNINVFLSCPKDIIKEGNIVDIVEKIIQQDNIYLRKFGIQLELKHWKKNVYLGQGIPRVQDRINHRLVENCDIFLGILWTRFGSPPGTNLNEMIYGSGTEEEFYLAQRLDKELWIFFCDFPIRPSKINLQQLEKVRNFKEVLKKEQIEYAEFSSEEEFLRLMKTNISEWLGEKYSPERVTEKEMYTSLPTKEDFRKYNKGF